MKNAPNVENFKVSLVIPAYNEEKYIGECLDYAIESAGNKFYEIIVIDNASTDNTRAIAEKRSGVDGARVRVVREDNKGLTRARQRGFIEAKGDILAYIDADTHMPAGWYDTIVREFSKNDNLACLSGPYIYYGVSKIKTFSVKLYYWIAKPIYLVVGYMATGGNFAIRKTVLEKMGGFDTTIVFYGEDIDIARRASKFGKVKFKNNFVMYTSPRRLDGQGFFNTAWVYVINFFSEVLRHRPTNNADYKDIR